jgi:hypothetical protein
MNDLLAWFDAHLEPVRIGLSLHGHRYPAAPAHHISLLDSLLADRRLPGDFAQFLRWSNGLLWASSTAPPPRGMAGTELSVHGTVNLVRGRHVQRAACLREPLPPEVATVLLIGQAGAQPLGLLLPRERDEPCGGVLLFDAFADAAGLIPTPGFTVIAGSWTHFLERLRFCMRHDLRLDPANPAPHEWAFMRGLEATGFAPPSARRYSFARPHALPSGWETA